MTGFLGPAIDHFQNLGGTVGTPAVVLDQAHGPVLLALLLLLLMLLLLLLLGSLELQHGSETLG